MLQDRSSFVSYGLSATASRHFQAHWDGRDPICCRIIRSSPYRGYIIFFRYLGDTFEVVNILHSRRDIDDFFATDATS